MLVCKQDLDGSLAGRGDKGIDDNGHKGRGLEKGKESYPNGRRAANRNGHTVDHDANCLISREVAIL
ncbi:hypothetical protein VAWG006_12270 [Aeromonas enteropelogenes]|nr:hypothetical protein VAWG006_12270 [Aeromonas enteropelogenes]BEE21139.1 hypothetical protein VAWG007_12340 [Aeromonas enteropelogenes]